MLGMITMKKHKKIIIIALIIVLIALCMFIVFNTNSSENTEVHLNGEGVLVLCYHRVIPSNFFTKLTYNIVSKFSNDDELKLYSVLSSDFEDQLKYLKENDVHFITASELEDYVKNKITLPSKSVLVTFDDVDISVYNTAFPILKKEKIPFTLFLITRHIGNENFEGLKLSDMGQIRDMVDSGLATVGSHTHSFHYFGEDGNPVFMNPKNHNCFIEDMKLSIETLEENFGFERRYFAYPYGFGTPETDEILLDLDFGLIFSLRSGIVKPGDPSFFTKRVPVTKESWKDIVKWVEE